MSLGRIAFYSRISSYNDLLGNNVLIYVYGKDKDLVNRQLNFIKNFCFHNGIKFSNIYIDMGCANFLKNKTSLQKLLKDNPNSTVLISNTDRLSRNIFDYIEIKNQMFNNKIKFFNITTNEFEFNVTLELLNELLNDTKRSDENMENTINALLVEPNKLPVKIQLKDELEELQKLVGGNIEYTSIPNCDDVAIICNEEGKINGLPVNRDIGYDIIVGTFLIVGTSPDCDTNISLTDEQIEKYTNMFDEKSIERTKEKYNNILKSRDEREI